MPALAEVEDDFVVVGVSKVDEPIAIEVGGEDVFGFEAAIERSYWNGNVSSVERNAVAGVYEDERNDIRPVVGIEVDAENVGMTIIVQVGYVDFGGRADVVPSGRRECPIAIVEEHRNAKAIIRNQVEFPIAI